MCQEIETLNPILNPTLHFFARTITKYTQLPPEIEFEQPLPAEPSPHAVYLLLPPAAAGLSFFSLQHVAACCSVFRLLECAVVYFSVFQRVIKKMKACSIDNVLLDCACSVLQYVAVCCSMLQCAAVCNSVLEICSVDMFCWIACAVCCSVLQCVAVCCSVLEICSVDMFCYGAYCSVFVAVCALQ